MQTNPGASDTRLLIPPRGIVTFLFTDIEGSTTLLQRIGPLYKAVLLDHQRLLRAAWAAHQGYEVDTQGDSFFVAFSSAREAVAAAAEATQALASYAWPEGVSVHVRVGLHTGTADVVGENYIGLDVHRAARIAAAGHGGQILLSQTTVELVRDTLPAGSTLRDLGAHRLKDLLRSEPLYQLLLPGLPDTFPPLKTLDRAPNNLPILPTPLIGRERELGELRALLRQPDVRLVSLLGPGGVGKTSLALQLAADLSDQFPDGVYFVALAAVSDGNAVLPLLMQTLGVREAPGEPLEDTLRSFLREKKLLLVLDNLEQIAEPTASIATTLLSGVPRLKVLTTTRAPLRVRGEHEYPVPPLGLPDIRRLPSVEDLAISPAVHLFIQRAVAAQPSFTLIPANALAVAQVCVLLDGLPLALELAAARIKVLPPAALLARLAPETSSRGGGLGARLRVLVGGARDLPARQRSLTDTIAWSYNLLTEEERALFRRLAVFVDGWTLEAAEAVVPAGGALGIDVLDGLESLVEKSLIQRVEDNNPDEARFRMLQVIREFGLLRLDETGEAAAVRTGHMRSFVELAEQGHANRVSDSVLWRRRLETEHENLLAALTWARDTHDARVGLRLAVFLSWFWTSRGYVTEGHTWLETFLALDAEATATGTDPADPDDRGRAFHNLGRLLATQGDLSASEEYFEKSLAVFREAGDQENTAVILLSLSANAINRLEYARAEDLLTEGLTLVRTYNLPKTLQAYLGVNLGVVLSKRGELDRAATQLEESERLLTELGDGESAAIALENRGIVVLRSGDAPTAERLLRECLHRLWDLGVRREQPICLEALAQALAAQDQDEMAARVLGMAAALYDDLGTSRVGETEAMYEEVVSTLRERMGAAWYDATFAAGRAADRDIEIPRLFGADSGADR